MIPADENRPDDATPLGPDDATPKPRRPRARKPGDRASRLEAARVAKRADPSLTKCSFYLPNQLATKLIVHAAMLRVDQSDAVTAILSRELSSVVFYDSRTKARATGDDGEDRQEGRAA